MKSIVNIYVGNIFDTNMSIKYIGTAQAKLKLPEQEAGWDLLYSWLVCCKYFRNILDINQMYCGMWDIDIYHIGNTLEIFSYQYPSNIGSILDI